MALTGNTLPTLVDLARRKDGKDKIDMIVEIISESNPIMEDMAWRQGNLLTGHKTTQRTGLPSVTWRKLNYGVAQSKSQTQQITDTCGMLEAYAEVDKKLVDLNGNTVAFRLSEDAAFLEAMTQEMAGTVFYGDTTSVPEEFMGLSPRFDVPSTTKTNIGYHMITGGGSGSDNTSIWLIGWGEQGAFGIVPKNIRAGFIQTDKGQVTLEDANGGKFEGYRTHYEWNAGLTVRNWKNIVRICNIDVSALTGDASGSSADVIDLMIQALELVQGGSGLRFAFYVPQVIRSILRRQIKNDGNVRITQEQVAGKTVTFFDGVPVRRCDQILETEATISGTFAHS